MVLLVKESKQTMTLALSLLALNAMAMGVCLSTLYSFGPEVKEVFKAFLVEQYFALTAIIVFVLAVERFSLAVLCYAESLSKFSAKAREHLLQFMAQMIVKGFAVKDGDKWFLPESLVASILNHSTKSDAPEPINASSQICTSPSNELALVSTTNSSQSCTPMFEESNKEGPLMNEDACSAATTM